MGHGCKTLCAVVYLLVCVSAYAETARPTRTATLTKEEYEKLKEHIKQLEARRRLSMTNWAAVNMRDVSNTNVVEAIIQHCPFAPSEMAVLINNTNRPTVWMPLRTNYTVHFQQNVATQFVWFYFRWSNSPGWYGDMQTFEIDRTPPHIFITNMMPGRVSQPLIFPEGYITEFGFKECTVQSSFGQRSLDACITSIPDWETNYHGKKEKYFLCDGVELDKGSNVVTFRLEDSAGNVNVTNIVFILDLKSDRVPPKFLEAVARAAGDRFIIQGRIDDPSVALLAYVTADGKEQERTGKMGLRGEFEIGPVAFVGKTNSVLLVATDSAGNVGRTNLMIIRP